MARDSFFQDFEVVEEKKLGPVTVLLVRDVTINEDDPDWNWGYAIRTDFKTAVQDEELKLEAHVVEGSERDFADIDFDDVRDWQLGDMPDDTVCHFSMSGDTEDEMRSVFDRVCEKFKRYGESV